MSGAEALEHYVNEHLAGAASALRLVERCRADNEDTPLASYLLALGPQIEADKQTLEDMLSRVGRKHRIKEMAGQVAERVSRSRLAEAVTSDEHLTRLLELETLVLGVSGKLALWRSIAQVAEQYPELADFDLAALAARADEQLRGLEGHRREAAAAAFSRSG